MEVIEYYQQSFHTVLLFSLLALMPLLESFIPLRGMIYSLPKRWGANFLLGITAMLAQYFLVPVLGIGFSLIVQEEAFGLFNQFEMPLILAIVLTVAILDGSEYGLHIAKHKIPLLWRFHRIHHADGDYDFTTSLRFHPVDALVTVFFKLLIIGALGLSPLGVMIAEGITLVINLFEHSNINIPRKIEQKLRLLCVTPDMHRIHHCADKRYTNSNYSTIFPYWDYLGGTYTPVENVNSREIEMGLEGCEKSEYQNIFWLLIMPFLSNKD